jgi:hypothetical protein
MLLEYQYVPVLRLSLFVHPAVHIELGVSNFLFTLRMEHQLNIAEE